MHEITIPTLNSNDVDYFLVEWCVAAGERVTADQPVAVIETSKAAEELLANAAGVLDHAQPAGSRCRPGTVIGRVFDSEEQRRTSAASPAVPAVAGHGSLAGTVLTNSARALIARHNVPEEQVRGLGKRVVRGADVLSLVDKLPAPAPRAQPACTDAAPASTARAADQEAEILPLSAMQQAIAATVTAALAVPAAFTVVKVYLDGTGENPVIPELVIRATAAQRSRYPAFFARLADDRSLLASRGAQIGLTVDVGHGLYMPVLRDAESMSVRDISEALLRFRVQARRGRFTASELAGGNIGITLHTESAVVLAQPIIHPGNTCALAVCAALDELQQMPDGSLRPRSYFHLGLAYDHRVINGRDATLFLDAIKRDVEHADPASAGARDQ